VTFPSSNQSNFFPHLPIQTSGISVILFRSKSTFIPNSTFQPCNINPFPSFFSFQTLTPFCFALSLQFSLWNWNSNFFDSVPFDKPIVKRCRIVLTQTREPRVVGIGTRWRLMRKKVGDVERITWLRSGRIGGKKACRRRGVKDFNLSRCLHQFNLIYSRKRYRFSWSHYFTCSFRFSTSLRWISD